MKNYIEPFFGSGAVLFRRPHKPGIETVNDKDGFIANFWRAVKSDPDAVASHADNPVLENDLHARHVWLRAQAQGLSPRLEADPCYYDAKIAGWWVWGVCNWIGGGWCGDGGIGPWVVHDGSLVDSRRLQHLPDGRGVTRELVHLGGFGRGVSRPGVATDIVGYCRLLCARLARVRVCCGDWSRVCGPVPTVTLGLTGVFLDPPYSVPDRDTVYREDDFGVSTSVAAWCRERGHDPRMRIVLAGYNGEHDLPGWRTVRWKAKGGYGNQGDGRGRENAHRETLWLSPYCLPGAVPGQMEMDFG